MILEWNNRNNTKQKIIWQFHKTKTKKKSKNKEAAESVESIQSGAKNTLAKTKSNNTCQSDDKNDGDNGDAIVALFIYLCACQRFLLFISKEEIKEFFSVCLFLRIDWMFNVILGALSPFQPMYTPFDFYRHDYICAMSLSVMWMWIPMCISRFFSLLFLSFFILILFCLAFFLCVAGHFYNIISLSVCYYCH